MASKMVSLQGGEAHFFEESMNPGKVKEYLGRPKVTLCLTNKHRASTGYCVDSQLLPSDEIHMGEQLGV